MSAAQAPSAPPELDGFARRFRAAEELWARGYPAESYLLLRDALRSAAATLRRAPEPQSALLSELDALLAEAVELRDPDGPAADYTRRHAAWLERARTFSARLLRDRSRRKRRLGRRSAIQIAIGAGLVVAVLVALVISSARIQVWASGMFSIHYPPSHAVDGLAATEWLLPEAQPGHLDLVFPARRKVRAVVLTNTHNRSHLDRAAKRVRVVVLDGTREVDAAFAEFTQIAAPAVPRRVALRGLQGTRLRIEVLEFLGRGGGLAEVSVE